MKTRTLLLCLALLLVVAVFLSLRLGTLEVSFKDIYHFLSLSGELDANKRLILLEVRLPRILMSFLIGALLASSGVVTQNVFANPIADPYIIGIAQAATLGAVLAFILKLQDFWYGGLSFICCVVFCLFIFNVARRANITTLLIIGIAFSAFLGAFTSFSIYLIGEDSFKIVAWLMGYVGNASWLRVGILLIPLGLTLVYFISKSRELNIMLCGDEEAMSLGLDVFRLKRNLLIVSSVSVAFSVAFSGLIGFVGLIVPHMFRLILRNSNNLVLIPLSAFGGGIFLLSCDTFSRFILSPIEIPIGIISAFLGAPFFLYLALFQGRLR